MTQRLANPRATCVSADLLHAAITHSSIAVAVCDQDFTVRFCNPSIARLLGDMSGGLPPAVCGLPGETLLELLGVDDGVTISDIGLRSCWSATAGRDAAPGTGGRYPLQIVVEALRENDRPAGWLITARECDAPAAPTHLSDQALIAASGKLSVREREVMLALAEGSSNKAIAIRLSISHRTVEFHRARIMQRFGAKSIVDLVRKVTRDAQAALAPDHAIA